VANSITIVGVGALGSHAVQLLRNVQYPIKVIDFDRLEQRNCASQFGSKHAVGKSKAVGLKNTMAFLWSRSIEAVPHRLTADNVEVLLGNSEVILDCVDNGETRRLIQDHAKKTHTPCLHGALAANGEFGRVVWTEDFRIDDETEQGAKTCEDGEFLFFIAIVSAYLAQAAQAFLANGSKIGFQVYPSGSVQV
jgi:molybdopterin/thiamine biosynthesis adenylyltransferase